MDKENKKVHLKADEFLNESEINFTDEDGEKESLKIERDPENMESLGEDPAKYDYKQDDNQEIGQIAFPAELAGGFWLRFWAFLFDSLIAGGLGKLLIDMPLNLLDLDLNSQIYGLVLSLVTMTYFTLMTYFNQGQTLGKMVLGLKVVRMDGEKLDFLTVFIREFIGRFIHSYSFLKVLYVITAFNDYKQNLSDYFADTCVIQISKEEIYRIKDYKFVNNQ